MNFDRFFKAATGHPPFGYQCRLACGERPDGEQDPAWLEHGAACQSRLINIPTGLGKTAAVVLAWLWNRTGVPKEASVPASAAFAPWPRRLVYCLPMRTLVEQTRDNVFEWLVRLAYAAAPDHASVTKARAQLPPDAQQRLKQDEAKLLDHTGELAPAREDLLWLVEHSPVILMGGEENDEARREWDIYPEKPAILIGTQDMLLSRALNRGYGMSRYRWPMHFGLLNNDCLWVMDETQLMGVGLETSSQMDGFRHFSQWFGIGGSPTWWMSATLNEERVATVDHPKPAEGWEKTVLSDAERAADGVRERFEARKPVLQADLVLSPATKESHARELAALIAEKHSPGTLTLVVVNRVPRARKLYEILLRDKKFGMDPSRLALIHSRFRPVDRARHMERLFGEGDRIVIATQAVEAGVDISARLLITELAPWSSLVQRLGRCNRRGELNDTAEIIWIDIQPKDEKDDLLLPYSADELQKAREAIAGLSDAGPRSLDSTHVAETPVVRPVLRRRDLIDLFDTTPDLCGQDLDISRYLRDGEDTDVQFFWREIPDKSDPTPAEKPPRREELCRVSIGEARRFFDKKTTRKWQWNALDEAWQKVGHARPGWVYLIDSLAGGYDDELGWTGDPKSRPTPHPPVDGDAEAYGKDALTFARYWLPLADHNDGVQTTMGALAGALGLSPSLTASFRSAALWHDAGKAHPEFQKALRAGPRQPEKAETIYAKSKNPFSPKAISSARHGFRHELASALAWLAVTPADTVERDLVAYLIAAHHGKVRLSIRALPEEKGNPNKPDALFARGIWDQDTLPFIPGLTAEPVILDLGLMQMGEREKGPSWLARMIAVRDRLGPFRLAYLESLLRAADMRASASERTRYAAAS